MSSFLSPLQARLDWPRTRLCGCAHLSRMHQFLFFCRHHTERSSKERLAGTALSLQRHTSPADSVGEMGRKRPGSKETGRIVEEAPRQHPKDFSMQGRVTGVGWHRQGHKGRGLLWLLQQTTQDQGIKNQFLSSRGCKAKGCPAKSGGSRVAPPVTRQRASPCKTEANSPKSTNARPPNLILLASQRPQPHAHDRLQSQSVNFEGTFRPE